MSPQQSGRSVRRLGILIVLAALVFVFLAAFRAGPGPEIVVESDRPGIGPRTVITVAVKEPKRGLSDLHVEFVQGERVVQVDSRSYTPRKAWEFWGERTETDEFTVEVGSETLEGLEEGPAKVRVVAARAPAWLRFPQPAVAELDLEVTLRPPTLQVLSSFTYVKQGGAEAVIYAVGDSGVEDGVQAGEWWFPGFPLPGGGERERFAWFGAPYYMDNADEIRLVARDAVGNEARVAFIDQYTPRPPATDTIRVSDSFMERVVPEIMAASGARSDATLLENYLAINGQMRARNADVLVKIATHSMERFLWNERFLQMRNAKVMSEFADRRTYVYDGKEIDRQDHLGFDLASTRAAEIQASNDGVVVLARYFGIYGNAVVIDHGYGLLSLYGHLSSVCGRAGASAVERGEAIGRYRRDRSGRGRPPALHDAAAGVAGRSARVVGRPLDPATAWARKLGRRACRSRPASGRPRLLGCLSAETELATSSKNAACRTRSAPGWMSL